MEDVSSDANTAVKKSVGPMLGPAFVAAVAYVDPGNVAANITCLLYTSDAADE